MVSESFFSPEATERLTTSLNEVLASTYILYLKTQNFHWNIETPNFFSYHKMLEGQYEDLAEAIDTIAERIRIFKVKAAGTMEEFIKLSSLKESVGDIDAKEMIRRLLADHVMLADILHNKIQETQEFGDEGTADLYIGRLREHDKTAWMLKSHL